jgi:hypothetical protein
MNQAFIPQVGGLRPDKKSDLILHRRVHNTHVGAKATNLQ